MTSGTKTYLFSAVIFSSGVSHLREKSFDQLIFNYYTSFLNEKQKFQHSNLSRLISVFKNHEKKKKEKKNWKTFTLQYFYILLSNNLSIL